MEGVEPLINKQHHTTLAKFRQAISDTSTRHHQSLQQTPQISSSSLSLAIQKQQEAFQPLVPSSTSSKYASADSVLSENDPFHTDNMRVPYSQAFHTSLGEVPTSSPSSESIPLTVSQFDKGVSLLPKPIAAVPAPSTTTTDFESKSEFRILQTKLERMSIAIETMQMTMQQLFYDFLVYVMIGILCIFALDQYTVHRKWMIGGNASSSSSSIMYGGGSVPTFHYVR
jgi:hypothetical protein